MSPDQASNERVTLAVVKNELDHVRDDIRELRADILTRVVANDSRIRVLEGHDKANEQHWKGHDDLHRTERGILGIGSIIGNVVAGLVGYFGGRP